VRVDLETGGVVVLSPGGPHRAWSRPRYSPDGSRIVAARNDAGRWRIMLVDAHGAGARPIDPDDGVDRYAPVFTPEGTHVVAVSQAKGVYSLVQLDTTSSTEQTVARTVAGVVAPVFAPSGDLYFLRMHADGLSVARLNKVALRPLAPLGLTPRLAPAAPPHRVADSLSVVAVGESAPYGAGPRRWGFLPVVALAAGEREIGFAMTNTDPVGRLSVLVQGVRRGAGASSVGGAIAARLARPRRDVTGELFTLSRGNGGAEPADTPFQLRGMSMSGTQTRWNARGGVQTRVALSHALLAFQRTEETRTTATVEASAVRTLAATDEVGELGAVLHATGGRTAADAWVRVVGRASVRTTPRGPGLRLQVEAGALAGSRHAVEAFSVGGTPVTLLDPAVLSQVIPVTGLPPNTLRGVRFATAEASLSGSLVEPFVWSGAAGEGGARSRHLVGVRARISPPSLPSSRLPATTIVQGGLAYGVGPLRSGPNAWVQIVLRP